MRVLNVKRFIYLYYSGSQAAFAREQGVSPPQVTQWIQKGFVVIEVDSYFFLFSSRRSLICRGVSASLPINARLRHAEQLDVSEAASRANRVCCLLRT